MTIPTEHAWQIHSAQMDWTGKVDAKASFALALDSAAIAALVALSGENMVFADLRFSWVWFLYWASVILLTAGGLAALLAVVPSLRKKKLEEEKDANFIYFGHVRHWHAENLEIALRHNDPLPVLSRQIVNMADILWKKHIKVALSLSFVGAGILAMLGTALFA